jgi:hypothetical protein
MSPNPAVPNESENPNPPASTGTLKKSVLGTVINKVKPLLPKYLKEVALHVPMILTPAALDDPYVTSTSAAEFHSVNVKDQEQYLFKVTLPSSLAEQASKSPLDATTPPEGKEAKDPTTTINKDKNSNNAALLHKKIDELDIATSSSNVDVVTDSDCEVLYEDMEEDA